MVQHVHTFKPIRNYFQPNKNSYGPIPSLDDWIPGQSGLFNISTHRHYPMPHDMSFTTRVRGIPMEKKEYMKESSIYIIIDDKNR